MSSLKYPIILYRTLARSVQCMGDKDGTFENVKRAKLSTSHNHLILGIRPGK